MTDGHPYDIEVTHLFDASSQRVYEAFTVPDQFAGWYGPVGFPVLRDTVELDARVGGRQRFVMISDADPAMRTGFDGRFTEVVEMSASPAAALGMVSQVRPTRGRRTCSSSSMVMEAGPRCGARGSSPRGDGRPRPPGVERDVHQA